MRSVRLMLALLCCGGIALASMHPDDAAVVRDVRYTVTNGTGTLKVGTTGTPIVVSGQHGSLVTLAFHHATVSSPPGAAHLYFTEGPMRSAVIERSGSDSITVFVRLRKTGTIHVGMQGHDVVLRVTPGARSASPMSSAPVRHGPISAELAAQLAAQTGVEVRSSTGGPISGAAGGFLGGISILAAIALCTFALLTSFGAALAIVRIQETRKSRLVRTRREENVREQEPDEPMVRSRESEPEVMGSDEEEETDDEREERAYQLAKAMRRGKGEMDLALRLEHEQKDSLGVAINKNTKAAATKEQRVRNAKRLGVGRGEFDLALRLKSMTPGKTMEAES